MAFPVKVYPRICHFFNFFVFRILTYLTLDMQVMSIKAVGIAIKLTVEGSSQAANFETWVFVMVSISCIIIQLNYLNKVKFFALISPSL